MTQDLTSALDTLRADRHRSVELFERSMAAASGPGCRHAFVRTGFDTGRAVATAQDTLHAAGLPRAPLAGLAVSIKDLFDVRGEVSAAASVVLADRPSAAADCPAVARLRGAGAAFIGRSNMSEFAFSGVGINPHHGTPANAATAALDTTPRIPGGSTSGGAVSVAAGAAWAALGSDTGGSLRIPAALQGLVGFKGTAGRVPLDGALPLSTTLDTAGAITRSVRDAVVLHEILAACTVALAHRPVAALRLAVPTTLMLDELDATVAAAFERSLAALRTAGARIDEVELPALLELAQINAAGGFPAAESWTWHRRLLADHGARYDPRVAMRIRRGEAMTAADYIGLLQTRRDWIARMDAVLQRYDALLCPTLPIVAAPIAPLVADDAAFFAANGKLLRNPSVVNFLDGCALSLPCQRDDELPVGLMVWSSRGCDDVVLDASLAIEVCLAAVRH